MVPVVSLDTPAFPRTREFMFAVLAAPNVSVRRAASTLACRPHQR